MEQEGTLTMTKSTFLGHRLRTRRKRRSSFLSHRCLFVRLSKSGSWMVVSVATALCLAGLREPGVFQDCVLWVVWFGLGDLRPRGPEFRCSLSFEVWPDSGFEPKEGPGLLT